MIHVHVLKFSVYNRHGYVDIVNHLAEHSMQRAVEEVQSLPDYPTKGEVMHIKINNVNNNCYFYLQWIIPDARHNSTANVYHTTVPCISGR